MVHNSEDKTVHDFVFINGLYCEKGKALLPLSSRGFLYGDGLFETIRGYNGTIFAIDMHLERLFSSMLELKFNSGVFSRDYIKSAAMSLLEKNRLLKCGANIKIIVARTAYKERMLFDYSAKPDLIITAERFSSYAASFYEKGISISTSSIKRNGTGNNLYRHKLLNYLENVFAKNEAAASQAQEAVFTTNDLEVLEGATSNIFTVRDSAVFTAPLSLNILPGITRKIVIDICMKNNIRMAEQGLQYNDLIYADEVFLTNSLMEIMPVNKVDSHEISAGHVPGPLTLKISALYRNLAAN